MKLEVGMYVRTNTGIIEKLEGNKIDIYERLDKNFVEIEKVLEMLTEAANELKGKSE